MQSRFHGIDNSNEGVHNKADCGERIHSFAGLRGVSGHIFWYKMVPICLG